MEVIHGPLTVDVKNRMMMSELPHGHDYWSTRPSPLTPPVSPVAGQLPSFCASPIVNDVERHHPICDFNGDDLSLGGFPLDCIDSPPCSPTKHCSDDYPRLDVALPPSPSMIIRDCMWWSAEEQQQATTQRSDALSVGVRAKKLSCHDFTLAGFKFESPTSKIASVDPSEIFPSSLVEFPGHFLSSSADSQSDSEDDSDVDIETVESTQRIKKNCDNTHQYTVPCLLTPPKTPECVDQCSGSVFTTSMSVIGGQCITLERRLSDVGPLPIRRQMPLSIDDDDDSDCLSSRHFSKASHNILERRRRNELKQRFYNLRDCMPDMSQSDKVPKVTILRKAVTCIRNLKATESTLLSELTTLRKKNTELQSKRTRLAKFTSCK